MLIEDTGGARRGPRAAAAGRASTPPRQTLELLFSRRRRHPGGLPRGCRARASRGAARRRCTLALDQALGRAPDPRPWFAAPETYAGRIELAAPVGHTEPLLFVARRLLLGLAAWLAARHAGVDRYVLQLEHEDAPPTRLAITLGTASRDEARFTLLLREHLARLAPGRSGDRPGAGGEGESAAGRRRRRALRRPTPRRGGRTGVPGAAARRASAPMR
ncbi:MAG: hypothetical protein MZW92_29465 [Comamonadaceae bacterium]|nr:hypothetical protein [Comamonadaceae bacterium]